MKFLFAALCLTTLAAPVAAHERTWADYAFEGSQSIETVVERRSGLCHSIDIVQREGSTCGGV